MRAPRPTKASLTAALLLGLGGGGGPAEARPPSPTGTAVVQSIDGPSMVTVTARGRALRLRLHEVDAPSPGECGATQATAALRGFVRRAPRRLRYQLLETYDGELGRDAAGRYVATLGYGNWRASRDLSSDLLRADWGRRGTAPRPDGLAPTEGDLSVGGVDQDLARPRRGLWAICGGRVHLPLGQPVPASAPAAWDVDSAGIARSIGPITVSPTLTPDTTLTLRRFAELVPSEFVWAYAGCEAHAPSLQIYARAAYSGPSCGDAPVTSIRSGGPDRATLTRGSGVGQLASGLPALFPSAGKDAFAATWLLSGTAMRQWAWQTQAVVDREDRILTLAAITSPALPRR